MKISNPIAGLFKHKNIKILVPFWLLFFGLTGILNAQGVDDDKDLAVDTSAVFSIDSEEEWDLFGNQELLKLSLAFNLKEYQKYTSEPKYQDAVLTIHQGDRTVSKDVRIKPRGAFRRKYCAFPPLKVNIKKTEFDNEYLEKQTTFKFVTHCKYSSNFETYLLKEFLIYKLFNQISDMSFRVRLIHMEYIDTGKKKKVFSKYGFIIEHINSVSERSNAFVLKNEKLGQNIMNKDRLAIVAMFEYMIGNTDWSVTGLHNIKVLKINDFNYPDPFPVPYDFDYSGMVDADYAIPTEDLGIKSVTDRLYRGICLPEANVQNAKKVFIENKSELFKVIENYQYLDKREKRGMTNYLESFFDIIESENSFRYEIVESCIK